MKHSLAYRVFRKDIGRKIAALLMALLVFAAFEKQTQVTEQVSVRIEYVNAGEFERDAGWVLSVVQRSDPTRPLVVPPSDDRPRTMELQLQGTKESVGSLMDSPQRFVFDPTVEGPFTLQLEHLTGAERLLGAVRQVAILQPVVFDIVVEESRSVMLGREHLALRGSPLPGVRIPMAEDADALVFRPRKITLVGAKELLDEMLDPAAPEPLFEVDVQDRSGTHEFALDLRPELEGQLDVLERNVRVEIAFPLDMEPLGDPLRKEVHLIRELVGLEQNQELKERLDRGERLDFKADEDRTRLVQIFRPRGTRGTSAILESLAREDVLLLAPWHHVDDLGRIPVTLKKVGAFPEGWEARLADGESDRINVVWIDADEGASPAAGPGDDN